MRFLKGEHTDFQEADQPQDTWRSLVNGVVDSNGWAMCEPGAEVIYTGETGSTIVGTVPLPNGDKVIFVAALSGNKVIYREDSGTLHTACTLNLDFNASYPVISKYTYDKDGNIQIIFFSQKDANWNTTTPRIITIDVSTFLVKETTIGETRQFPYLLNGDIAATVNRSGGILPEGTYFFVLFFVYDNDDETIPTRSCGPFYVRSSSTRPKGTPLTSANSITLSLSSLDSKFTRLRIGMMRYVNGELGTYKSGYVSYSGSTKIITITGRENWTATEVEELTLRPRSFSSIRDVALINNSLFEAGVKFTDDGDLQSKANDITIGWTKNAATAITTSTVYLSANIAGAQGYMPWEIYAFYVRWKRQDGSFTSWFHIPGRVANAGDTDAITDYHQGSELGSSVKKFQVLDTCAVGGVMNYWENSTETYPSTFPDFAGQKVRHHRMPSLRWLKETGGYDIYASRLGITVGNVSLTDGSGGSFTGYEIGYAKGDGVVVGTSYLFNYNAIDGSGDPDTIRAITSGLRFHPFELLANKPPISGDYLFLDAPCTNPTLELDSTLSDGAKVSIAGALTLGGAVGTYKELTISPGTLKYFPGNNIAASTEYEEEYVGATSTYSPSLSNIHLATLCRYLVDIYTSYDSQIVATAGFATSASATIYNGDSFLSQYVFRIQQRIADNECHIINFAFNNISKKAIAFRHEGDEWWAKGEITALGVANINSNELPASGEPTTKGELVCTKSNYFDYDDSYDERNIYNGGFIVDEEPSSYLYRVYKFNLRYPDRKETNWRKYAPFDYYEQNKDRGPIIGLYRHGERLLIHHRRGLFITQSIERLSSTTAEIVLGQGDIFDKDPTEPLYTEHGYLGIASKFCGQVTKYGYLFVSGRRIFLLSDTLEEISAYGKRKFFRDNLSDDLSSSVIGGGLTIAYDDLYDRILICNRVDDWVYSYNPKEKYWIGSHVWRGILLNDGNTMYSIKDNVLYAHNDTMSPSYVYSQNVFSATVVLNPEGGQVIKLFNALRWVDQIHNFLLAVINPPYGEDDTGILTAKTIRVREDIGGSSHQDTGEYDIVLYNDVADYDTANTRRILNGWNHVIARNATTNSTRFLAAGDPIKAPYITVTLKYPVFQGLEHRISSIVVSDYQIVQR